eukprot:366082-Chlamydomonas_euryale.AAC.18
MPRGSSTARSCTPAATIASTTAVTAYWLETCARVCAVLLTRLLRSNLHGHDADASAHYCGKVLVRGGVMDSFQIFSHVSDARARCHLASSVVFAHTEVKKQQTAIDAFRRAVSTIYSELRPWHWAGTPLGLIPSITAPYSAPSQNPPTLYSLSPCGQEAWPGGGVSGSVVAWQSPWQHLLHRTRLYQVDA